MEQPLSYQAQIKKHLADYKFHHLGIAKPGIFLYRGREVECHHILPIEYRDQNLFEEAQPAAKLFFEANRTKRHRYFHHLNSSQAFAFNLFFPYFYDGPETAAVLLRALGQRGTFARCVPEAVPDPAEGSNQKGVVSKIAIERKEQTETDQTVAQRVQSVRDGSRGYSRASFDRWEKEKPGSPLPISSP
jgi:hypothetical protein